MTRNIQPRTYKFNLVEIFKIIYQVTVVFLLLCRIRVVSLSFRLVYNSRNLGFSYLLQIALDNRSHIGLVNVSGQSDQPCVENRLLKDCGLVERCGKQGRLFNKLVLGKRRLLNKLVLGKRCWKAALEDCDWGTGAHGKSGERLKADQFDRRLGEVVGNLHRMVDLQTMCNFDWVVDLNWLVDLDRVVDRLRNRKAMGNVDWLDNVVDMDWGGSLRCGCGWPWCGCRSWRWQIVSFCRWRIVGNEHCDGFCGCRRFLFLFLLLLLGLGLGREDEREQASEETLLHVFRCWFRGCWNSWFNIVVGGLWRRVEVCDVWWWRWGGQGGNFYKLFSGVLLVCCDYGHIRFLCLRFFLFHCHNCGDGVLRNENV